MWLANLTVAASDSALEPAMLTCALLPRSSALALLSCCRRTRCPRPCSRSFSRAALQRPGARSLPGSTARSSSPHGSQGCWGAPEPLPPPFLSPLRPARPMQRPLLRVRTVHASQTWQPPSELQLPALHPQATLLKLQAHRSLSQSKPGCWKTVPSDCDLSEAPQSSAPVIARALRRQP